VFLSKLVLKSK